MPKPEPSQRILVSGLLVSVLAHGAIWAAAAGFVRTVSKHPKSDSAQVVKTRIQPTVKLGIDDAKFKGLAWLGYQEPTEHQAPQAPVDQSAMTPAPGAPAQAALAPQPPPTPVLSSKQVQEAAQALSNMGKSLNEILKAAPRTIEASPPPTSVATKTTENPGASGAGDPGLNADKEAVGTSVKNALQVKLGKVAAAEGLDIQTRSPRWSNTTLATKHPANPTIQITFDRAGKVIRASFATEGKRVFSTGSPEVDDPLISAVYTWTARGKRLAELTSQDPNGEVTIMITVLFNG